MEKEASVEINLRLYFWSTRIEEMLQLGSKNAGLTNESIYGPDFGHLVLSHQRHPIYPFTI